MKIKYWRAYFHSRLVEINSHYENLTLSVLRSNSWTRMHTETHGSSSVFIRVDPCPLHNLVGQMEIAAGAWGSE